MRILEGIRIFIGSGYMGYADIWERLSKTDRPVIVYGTGNGADKVLDRLEVCGVTPCGIMASDDFVRGQSFRGYTVRRLDDLLQSFPEPIIILAFGSGRGEVIENILRLAGRHTVLCADVPVYGDNVFDRSFYKAHAQELEETRSLLADEQSRRVFDGVVEFKLYGELPPLTSVFTEKDEAFGSILKLGEKECFLDLGAYRGDTIAEFLRCTGGKYSHITALEPDRKTYIKLCEYAGKMNEVRLFNMGIWDSDCDLCFNSSLGRGSSVETSEACGEARSRSGVLAVTRIDTLYRRMTLTYLKMDVEGAEERAIKGGAAVIKRDKPKLNVALYHRSEDIFRLPLLIRSIRPDYKLYMRQHPHIPAWDMNLYGI